MVDIESLRILSVAQARGPEADLKLFRASGVQFPTEVWYLADLGYQGLQEAHAYTSLPVKKPKDRPLTADEKHQNRCLAKLRIRVEHVIRRLKVFRILSERYRNRRKRFGLRVRLIAGLYNFELASA